jgi:hypothetical protein
MERLNSASSEPVLLKKIAAYSQISNSMVKDIAHFEMGRFVDGITSIFSLRKKMIPAEINALKDLLTYLNSASFKTKNIFDTTTQKTFATWLNIVQGTSVLSSNLETMSLKDQVMQLKNILTNISVADASHERSQLVSTIIPKMFNSRGDYLKEDLEVLKDLFVAIQNKPGLLASNQISTIVAWINELDNAIKITDGKNTYISALLSNAISDEKTENLGVYKKIAVLFTPATPVPVLAAFIGALNGLFKTRNSYDKTALLKLFQIIDQRKLSNGTNLLGAKQKDVMGKWIKILAQEIKNK